jgi:hypothetical protein
MPPSEINQLSDIELVEAAGAATEDRTQHQIQAEMWRRTTLEARRAGLAAMERGRRGETIALWAIELALLAILLALILLGSMVEFGGSSDNAVVGGIIVTVTAVLGNGVVLLVTANERAVARARLRGFDAEQ